MPIVTRRSGSAATAQLWKSCVCKHSRVRVPPPPHMTLWKLPPIIKIYEALGCVADGRIEVDGNSAKVHSSSGNKYYIVSYDPNTSAIMCNDNGSFWQGYLGYPAISYLLKNGVIPYTASLANLLRDIAWKDVNTKFKNDWDKTEKYCQSIVMERGGDLPALLKEIESIYNYLKANPFSLLGKKTKPPSGY